MYHMHPGENLELTLDHTFDPIERARLIDEAYLLLGSLPIESVITEETLVVL